MSNITQDLFAAIDTIVQKRMNEMSFDTTIVGEIKEKKTDHYMVQHGNTAYIAYALNNESYLVGDQVYITIPQGDYNAKKIIVGKVSDNEKVVDQSFLWPVDSIVDIDNKNVTIGSADLKGKYEPQNVNNSLLGTRVLGVKATFQTNLPDASSENSYGLAFSINGQIFGVLDSSEFYNNPFMYLNGYTVEKVIELPYNASWPDITVQFYKRLDNTADSAKIDCTHLNLTLGLKTLVDEENKEITAPKLKLYLNDNQSVDYFSSDKEYKKTINSIFIENKKGYYTGKSLPQGYEIKYFEYKSGYGTDDILAGPNWKHLTNFDSSMSDILYTIGTKDRTAQRNEYRVKAIVKNNKTLVAEDIIVFKNIDGGKTDETLGQPNNNDLLIAINGDINHNGIFNVYDSKNCYADDLSKQIINLKVVFADGTEIRESDLIEWTFPQDLTQLLIHYPESEGPELDISKTQSNYSASLRPYFYPGERDTIIKCKVIKNGITYYASKLLTFGYKESQGTSYRLNVKIKRSESENAVRNIMFNWDDELILVPELRDKWGFVVKETDIKFEYSWYYDLKYKLNDGKEYQHWTLDIPEDTKSCVVRLSAKTKPDGLEHDSGNPNGDLLGCPIVKVKTNTITLENGLEAQFTTYVPIIWALDNSFANTYTDGATDITIGQLGGYNYNTSDYQIYNYPGGEVFGPAILNADLDSDGKQAHPKLKIENNKLKIDGQLLLEKDKPAVLIWKQTIEGNKWTVWRQPILITQSTYENDILNSWNGSQKIDEKGNYILSSMLGAGTKNNANQFTGFMMGKARFIENNITQDKIGLFGFKEGKRTFEVNENGNAYFEGTIQANAGLIGGWDINSKRIGSWTGKSTTAQTKNAIYIASAKDTSDYWLRAYNSDGDITFGVSKTGQLTAEDANITGTITATTLILTEASKKSVANVTAPDIKAAQDTAYGAQKTAEAAQGTANTAKGTADGASTKANNAELLAQQAAEEASNAAKNISNEQLERLKLERFYIVGDQIYDNTTYQTFEAAFGADSTCFTVSKEGLITAANAVIKGTIYAGAGLIGGWDINSSRIGSWINDKSKTKKAIYIASASDKTSYWLRAFDDNGKIVFGVSKTGQLTATGATITGTLNANAGRIGGWSIAGNDKGYFYSTAPGTDVKNTYFYGKGNGTVIIDDDTSLTNLVMRVGPENAMTFGITTEGKVYANKGDIAGWNFDSYRMYNANDKWGTGLSTSTSEGDPAFWAGYTGAGATPWTSTNGWTTETKFYVTNTGFLKATNAEIEGKITANQGGKIGGWIIDAGQDYIKSSDSSIWLNGDCKGTATATSPVGMIAGSALKNIALRIGTQPNNAKFAITKDGKIYATEGAIGDWRIVKISNSNQTVLYGEISADNSSDGVGYNIIFSPRQIQFDQNNGVYGETYVLSWKELMQKVGTKITYNPAVPMSL